MGKKKDKFTFSNKGKLTLAWCDNGTVDGKFMEGMMAVAAQCAANGIQLSHTLRVQGNQIGRQRQALTDYWLSSVDSDWLLWVDSDIVIDIQMVASLLELADPKDRPIVSGVYFISKEPETTLDKPMPCIFLRAEGGKIQHVHPLPEDTLLKVDYAGLGLVIIHKSVFKKLKEKFPNDSFYAERQEIGDKFVGEDIVFFEKVYQAGIPVFAHTSIIGSHIKRFSLDFEYYAMYWAMNEMKRKLVELESNSGDSANSQNN